ncbi:hypothetical protein [Mycolicibacterium sp. XJ1819]
MSDLFRRISHQPVRSLFMFLSAVAFVLLVVGLALKSSLAPVAGIAFVIATIASISEFRGGPTTHVTG